MCNFAPMKEMLTIGFDAKRIVRNGTGLGSYGRTLINDLAAIKGLDLRLYAPDKGREDLREQVSEQENVHYVYPQIPHLPLLTGLCKSHWRSVGILKNLETDGVQVFHGLSGELPIGIRKTGIKTVVTIHDLIFMRHPEYYNWIDVQIYKRKFFQTLREADRIVAISECTRRDISELGGIPKESIDLIYQSCATRFAVDVKPEEANRVSAHYQLPKRYVLSVGSIEERKNMLLAVKSLPFLPEDVHLVMVGKATKYSARILQEAQHSGLTRRIHVLHGVPDVDLPALYTQAEAFVYPSRYEGFGIPIIEAIRMGLPVVACTGSCLEEAGGPDSLYVNPDDAEGLAAALRQVLKGAEGRQIRIEKSQLYVRRFENNDAARFFANLYQELVSR